MHRDVVELLDMCQKFIDEQGGKEFTLDKLKAHLQEKLGFYSSKINPRVEFLKATGIIFFDGKTGEDESIELWSFNEEKLKEEDNKIDPIERAVYKSSLEYEGQL